MNNKSNVICIVLNSDTKHKKENITDRGHEYEDIQKRINEKQCYIKMTILSI